MMIFPRRTIRIGKCLAAINVSGKIVLRKRPVVRHEGEVWKGHRLSYHLNVAKIPRSASISSSDLILHTCDTFWCIDHNHLYKGSQKDNMRDMYERHPTIRALLSAGGLGKKFSDEHKEAISKSRMGVSSRGSGWHHSEETKSKISKSNVGKRIGISARGYGWTHDKPTRIKLQNKLREYWSDPDRRKRMSEQKKKYWEERRKQTCASAADIPSISP